MLTPAQQKVKQELEELQAAGRFHHKAPLEFHAPQPSSLKKWMLPLVVILLILLLVVMYLFHPNQSETVDYLVKEQHLYRQSEKLLNETLYEKPVDYQEAKMKQIELWKKLSELDSPSGLHDHKLDLLHVMEQQQEVLVDLTASKNIDSATFNQKMIELKVRQELAFDSLRTALERDKFKYETLEDGTVRYWVHSKIYTY
ncbi:hypothetical protein COJ85_18445 [Bacillus sp. AFS076308]|uniref:hypothetical protein n=1 Tax=unclassified Bacillus (in: firmicutes) TaxID=185979 RepID=UPI000BF84E24|nr:MULTISPECIES: hypothetical protein [unclassified Bacillus (in: firmicutes)]PFO00010.1 hypothetical protein COJ85_18445 [Bacillus sp. AFS076308]PGV51547.1 hypothetical protein COD92_13710 [Bacillus sp. AFS037270]